MLLSIMKPIMTARKGVIVLAKRFRESRRKTARMFKKFTRKTKKINLSPAVSRGGIIL